MNEASNITISMDRFMREDLGHRPPPFFSLVHMREAIDQNEIFKKKDDVEKGRTVCLVRLMRPFSRCSSQVTKNEK